MEEIPSTAWYRNLREYLTEETIDLLEGPIDLQPAIVAGYQRSDIDRILDEITRIERDWDLL